MIGSIGERLDPRGFRKREPRDERSRTTQAAEAMSDRDRHVLAGPDREAFVPEDGFR